MSGCSQSHEPQRMAMCHDLLRFVYMPQLRARRLMAEIIFPPTPRQQSISLSLGEMWRSRCDTWQQSRSSTGLAQCSSQYKRCGQTFLSVVQLFIAGKAWSCAIIGEDHRRYGVQKLVPPKKKLTRNVLVDWFCKVFIRYVKTRD